MKSLFKLIQEDISMFRNKDKLELKDYFMVLNPRMYPVVLVRISSFLQESHLGILAKIISTINFVLFGCDIAKGAKIQGGLYLPHPSGVVIGEYAIIGRNCIIHQGVTLGDRGEEHETSNPTLGDYVEIGTGAKVLGKILIDDYSRIGANSVVLKDTPKYAVAVGVPAIIIKYRKVI